MIETSQEINELSKALVAAQKAMPKVTKKADNPFFKSKYADLPSIWDTCRKHLHANDLAVIQTPVGGCKDFVHLVTILSHKSGQYIKTTFFMPVGKNTAHGVGSAVTYAKRYALTGIVGICPDDDDDGNAASEGEDPKITSMFEAFAMRKISEVEICGRMGVDLRDQITKAMIPKLRAYYQEVLRADKETT